MMESAENEYAEVVNSIQEAFSVPAGMQHLGGGCLAISWDTDNGGHFLLSESDGPITNDRAHLNGWMVGYYPTEDSDEAEFYLETTDSSTNAALELIRKALKKASA